MQLESKTHLHIISVFWPDPSGSIIHFFLWIDPSWNIWNLIKIKFFFSSISQPIAFQIKIKLKSFCILEWIPSCLQVLDLLLLLLSISCIQISFRILSSIFTKTRYFFYKKNPQTKLHFCEFFLARCGGREGCATLFLDS